MRVCEENLDKQFEAFNQLLKHATSNQNNDENTQTKELFATFMKTLRKEKSHKDGPCHWKEDHHGHGGRKEGHHGHGWMKHHHGFHMHGFHKHGHHGHHGHHFGPHGLLHKMRKHGFGKHGHGHNHGKGKHFMSFYNGQNEPTNIAPDTLTTEGEINTSSDESRKRSKRGKSKDRHGCKKCHKMEKKNKTKCRGEKKQKSDNMEMANYVLIDNVSAPDNTDNEVMASNAINETIERLAVVTVTNQDKC